ncbi:unnamed protein product [Jaminaea pallidilutea]
MVKYPLRDTGESGAGTQKCVEVQLSPLQNSHYAAGTFAESNVAFVSLTSMSAQIDVTAWQRAVCVVKAGALWEQHSSATGIVVLTRQPYGTAECLLPRPLEGGEQTQIASNIVVFDKCTATGCVAVELTLQGPRAEGSRQLDDEERYLRLRLQGDPAKMSREELWRPFFQPVSETVCPSTDSEPKVGASVADTALSKIDVTTASRKHERDEGDNHCGSPSQASVINEEVGTSRDPRRVKRPRQQQPDDIHLDAKDTKSGHSEEVPVTAAPNAEELNMTPHDDTLNVAHQPIDDVHSIVGVSKETRSVQDINEQIEAEVKQLRLLKERIMLEREVEELRRQTHGDVQGFSYRPSDRRDGEEAPKLSPALPARRSEKEPRLDSHMRGWDDRSIEPYDPYDYRCDLNQDVYRYHRIEENPDDYWRRQAEWQRWSHPREWDLQPSYHGHRSPDDARATMDRYLQEPRGQKRRSRSPSLSRSALKEPQKSSKSKSQSKSKSKKKQAQPQPSSTPQAVQVGQRKQKGPPPRVVNPPGTGKKALRKARAEQELKEKQAKLEREQQLHKESLAKKMTREPNFREVRETVEKAIALLQSGQGSKDKSAAAGIGIRDCAQPPKGSASAVAGSSKSSESRAARRRRLLEEELAEAKRQQSSSQTKNDCDAAKSQPSDDGKRPQGELRDSPLSPGTGESMTRDGGMKLIARTCGPMRSGANMSNLGSKTSGIRWWGGSVPGSMSTPAAKAEAKQTEKATTLETSVASSLEALRCAAKASSLKLSPPLSKAETRSSAIATAEGVQPLGAAGEVEQARRVSDNGDDFTERFLQSVMMDKQPPLSGSPCDLTAAPAAVETGEAKLPVNLCEARKEPEPKEEGGGASGAMLPKASGGVQHDKTHDGKEQVKSSAPIDERHPIASVSSARVDCDSMITKTAKVELASSAKTSNTRNLAEDKQVDRRPQEQQAVEGSPEELEGTSASGAVAVPSVPPAPPSTTVPLAPSAPSAPGSFESA